MELPLLHEAEWMDLLRPCTCKSPHQVPSSRPEPLESSLWPGEPIPKRQQELIPRFEYTKVFEYFRNHAHLTKV